MITVFASPFVANGYSTVWKPDGQNLYLTIMYYTRRYVVEAAKTLWATHQLVLPQWDFAIGQGASILSVFHINPLFLLAVVTPYRWMELVYNAVTVMQIPLAAWAFTVYCHSVEKREVLPGAYRRSALRLFWLCDLHRSQAHLFHDLFCHLPASDLGWL